MTKRNILIFFKDKQTIVFSLLTSMIVLVLYLLFLKGTFVDSMNNIIDAHPGLGSLIGEGAVDMFANLILITGILGSAMITVPYNCLTTFVKDKENKIDYDILSTPVRRGRIVWSYFVSASVSSVILNGIIMAVGLVIIGLMGDMHMSVLQIVKAFGVVALGSVSSTAFFMIIVMFFKSTGASGAFFGMLSAASGFVIGAYIPISQFSDGVQTVCNIFPASHVTILLRNILMQGILDSMDASIGGVDGGMFVSSMKEVFTFNADMFGRTLEINESIYFIIAVVVLCLVIQTVLFSKNYKKR